MVRPSTTTTFLPALLITFSRNWLTVRSVEIYVDSVVHADETRRNQIITRGNQKKRLQRHQQELLYYLLRLLHLINN